MVRAGVGDTRTVRGLSLSAPCFLADYTLDRGR